MAINKYYMDFSSIKLNEKNVIKPNMKLYEKLLNIQSPSGNEGNMIRFLIHFINKKFPNTVINQDKHGNLYVTKGKLNEGEFYPCLVAHLDEVHDFNPDRQIVKIGDFYTGFDTKVGERDGIGADDKNGIFAALTMLGCFDTIKLFFPVEEEMGMVGSRNCDMNFFKNVGYILQCDRRGYQDLITYTNGVDVTSVDFLIDTEEIAEEYNYRDATGMATDVGQLVINGVGVSGCNISCGYWNEHFEDEITHIPSLINCINFVYHIITICKKKHYEFHPKKKESYTDRFYSKQFSYDKDWDQFVDEYDYNDPIIEDHPCAICSDQDCMNCKHFS